MKKKTSVFYVYFVNWMDKITLVLIGGNDPKVKFRFNQLLNQLLWDL